MTIRKPKGWGAIKPTVGFGIDWSDPINKGLVGRWLFNEGAGNTVYDLARKNNGAFTSSPTWGTGKFGKAITFDGTASYVKVSAAPVTTYPLTMGAWAKLNSTTFGATNEMVFGSIVKTSGLEEFWFSYFNSGGTTFRSVVQSNSAANIRDIHVTVTLDLKWHFLVAVFIDASTHAIYYDGVLQAGSYTTSGTGTPTPSGVDTVDIGGFFYNTSNFYGGLPGIVDGLFILNRAITGAEVARLYSEPFAGIRSPRRRLWNPAAGVAPSFNPGWAYGATKTIGGVF